MVIRAHQHQVVQFGGATVFPVPDVVCVQSAGGAAARHGAGGVTVLECAAKSPVDSAGCSAGTDDPAVTLEPDLTGGITGEVLPLSVGQQRTEVQSRGALLDIDVHHHGGALPMRAAGCLGVPTGVNQAHERFGSVRHRPSLIRLRIAAVIMLPLGDQRIEMGLQGCVERGRLVMRQGDPPAGGLVAGGLGDRALRCRHRTGFGFGPRLEPDRRAQLVDRRYGRQLRVMLVRARAGTRGDDADLIQ